MTEQTFGFPVMPRGVLPAQLNEIVISGRMLDWPAIRYRENKPPQVWFRVETAYWMKVKRRYDYCTVPCVIIAHCCEDVCDHMDKFSNIMVEGFLRNSHKGLYVFVTHAVCYLDPPPNPRSWRFENKRLQRKAEAREWLKKHGRS